MLAVVSSATLLGAGAQPVAVEVHVSSGIPGFTIVGQPDGACRESRDRVRAALLSSGFSWPQRRVTVNLAPSGVPKVGGGLDLPIAIGLLSAVGDLPGGAADGMAFAAELGLDGSLRPVRGVLAIAEATGCPAIVVARPDAGPAALSGQLCVYAAEDLREVADALRGRRAWRETPPPDESGLWCPEAASTPPGCAERGAAPGGDLAEVRGQRLGRWALEVAAAGEHHLLMIGPPGAGKTMLASRLPGLLPPLERQQALETTRVHSAAGVLRSDGGLISRPPWRAPHHGASAVSLIGGGSGWMRPGEVSLATNGVLFLDEMGEFSSAVLDALRQPLEEGVVRVARAKASAAFPARFLLVGAMNPCPCGEGSLPGACRCTRSERARYARRLSGPLLDRFDLRVPVGRPAVEELLADARPEGTAAVAARVRDARAAAAARGVRSNARLPASLLDDLAPLTPAARSLLERRMRSGLLSARGLHRVRRVARTIADLQGGGAFVDAEHVAGALELRVDISALVPLEERGG